jgi:hypothetical protein
MAITSNDNLITFFTGQTINITTTAVPCGFNTGVLKIWGTWNGASVAIKTGVPGSASTFIPITDNNGNPLIFNDPTPNSAIQVTIQNIVQGDNIVVVLASAGAATNLNATLQRI